MLNWKLVFYKLILFLMRFNNSDGDLDSFWWFRLEFKERIIFNNDKDIDIYRERWIVLKI